MYACMYECSVRLLLFVKVFSDDNIYAETQILSSENTFSDFGVNIIIEEHFLR